MVTKIKFKFKAIKLMKSSMLISMLFMITGCSCINPFISSQKLMQRDITRLACDKREKIEKISWAIPLLGFEKSDFNTINATLIRSGHKVEEEIKTNKLIVENGRHGYYLFIPFENFFKTDTIKITIANKNFYLSDFIIETASRYGNCGYLFSECTVSSYTVNGIEGSRVIEKSQGIEVKK